MNVTYCTTNPIVKKNGKTIPTESYYFTASEATVVILNPEVVPDKLEHVAVSFVSLEVEPYGNTPENINLVYEAGNILSLSRATGRTLGYYWRNQR